MGVGTRGGVWLTGVETSGRLVAGKEVGSCGLKKSRSLVRDESRLLSVL